MKAKIRYFHSPDVKDLKSYRPKDYHFGFLLQMMVGPRDSEGEESFDIRICTPQWMLKNCEQDCVLFGRHYLIVFEYNYEHIVKKLTEYVERWDEPTWQDLAEKISRIGYWEFEDYREEKVVVIKQ